ncbi:MAG: NADP-specific glutamate dehydrogenase, partial [Clostridium sp.]
VDIAMPCATQNEIGMVEAQKMVDNGVKYLVEGANMPTSNEAIKMLQDKGVFIGPAKAANAGGVATSALEMTQNSMRLSWSEEEVDEKLHQIMINIHNNAATAAKEYGYEYNLVAGANIAGFLKVAEAMSAQGIY